MSIVNEATYNITLKKGENLVWDFTFESVNLTGAVVTYVVNRSSGASAITLLSSANAANANGSRCQIISATSGGSAIKVTLSTAEVSALAVGKYRHGVFVEDSQGSKSLWIEGLLDIRNV